jgi:hypothetical protein
VPQPQPRSHEAAGGHAHGQPEGAACCANQLFGRFCAVLPNL